MERNSPPYRSSRRSVSTEKLSIKNSSLCLPLFMGQIGDGITTVAKSSRPECKSMRPQGGLKAAHGAFRQSTTKLLPTSAATEEGYIMRIAEPFSLASANSTNEVNRIVVSSVIGTAVEWYDFLIYGTASALVFNKLFFPTLDPVLSTIAAFGTYAVGFLARPLGAAIFGHFGDRAGRKAMLVMTIIIMGIGTFLIGLLPTYEQIGIAAPVLLVLLRLLQGIGIGGEWGGAVLMVVENAQDRNRGLLGSMVQIGWPVGNLAAIGIFAGLSQVPESDFLLWAWRIPFLISIVLVGIGLYIRMQLDETPAFRR